MTYYTSSTIQEFLAGIYPFDQLSSAALAKLSTQFQLFRYRIGQAIVKREVMPAYVGIVYEGKARLIGYDPHLQAPVTLKLLQPGEMLGWVGLVRGVPCETAIASEETICLVLPSEDFLSVLERESSLANAFQNQCTLIEVFDLLGADLARQANSSINLMELALKAQSEAVIYNLLPGRVSLSQLDDERLWFVSGGGAIANFPVASRLNLENTQTYINVIGAVPARLVGFPKLAELLTTAVEDVQQESNRIKDDSESSNFIDAFPFLAEVLQTTHDSNSNIQTVYTLLQANLEKLNENLAQQLRTWAGATLPELTQSQAQHIATNIANFSNLIHQFPLGNKTCNVEIAITGYEIVAQVFTREEFPEQWAMLRSNQAGVYLKRIRGERAENLERAISFISEALQVLTRQAFPEQWAITQNNLGEVYLERIRGIRAENIELAITAFNKALNVLTYMAYPQQWAMTQNNLGLAFGQRIIGDKAENFEAAVTYYQEALKVYTREAFPSEWAATQNNLGLAFSERITGYKAENLQTAIACYQAALEVYTREAFPHKWADIRKNIGNVYIEKIHSNSLNNIDCLHNIEYAILFYQDALEIYTPEQFPDECLIVREKISNAHYLLEHYQRELELVSLSQPNISNEAIIRIELVRANLLDLEVDAIVRPTNTQLAFGGEISRQILQRLQSSDFRWYQRLQTYSSVSVGEVIVTEASPLPARYLFHTPIDNYINATVASVSQAIIAALNKAAILSDVRTIAFPSLGTGKAGLNPTTLASEILKIVTNHLGNGSRLEKVVFAFVDETAYQAYASAYQMLLLETGVFYNVSVTIPQETVSLGEDIEISVNLNQAEITQKETYTIQISHNDAIGSELNIILTAPGFQFNSDNTTSLPFDSDTINITQSAIFNLTALRSGKTKIKAELYCGETYKTTLETEVEVIAFDETEIPPLIAARSRPVPQPDIILQVRTTWNADISACTFNYHIDNYQPRLLFADDVDYNSQSLSTNWVERSHSLLKTTLEEAATSLREDFRSRLVSLGQYLFQCLLPEELQNTFRTIASFNHPFTLLILADQDAWFPWELLHDGQKFLGDRFIIGRWLWELEKARPYEFPVGAVNVAHYASVEQPELWTELLQSSGAPPPISMQAGIFNDITLFESIRGLHLIRYGQSVNTTNRQDAPVRVNSSSDIQDIEREVQPAKLSLRRNHPLVSLSYLNAGQAELTALEQTWASTFVRAGCSAFVGSLWAVQANVEAAFISAFYHSIWAGQTLGVAFQTARRLAKTVVPESLDWLAYVLFGDPMARPYRPVQGQGYAVVEPIGQEIDDSVSPGSTVRFRVSLRRTPPVWYENRLMEVAEDLSFDDLRVFIVTSGLQVTPGDSILMTRTATGDYLGWFTLTVPAEMESRSVLVQVYFEDGVEPVHNLRFALNIVKQDGEAQ
ncbi:MULTISPECIES: macro domain-containing protein [Calothrix]|uniref:Tetratricopeptide repeat protein n=2 Tax=Calothrix TaxID=1186 RepID=A0ABR8AN95_9CYAN|nr:MULTISPECIES: macro domain-containing protein [Calothrix]MBD2200738.1 tetratricopeptide repeat protein [Calothrix parietina FACHB-288]MBD2229794.1 tetratricopeptide repeat protein [Calothrix anomala FACHB-343]